VRASNRQNSKAEFCIILDTHKGKNIGTPRKRAGSGKCGSALLDGGGGGGLGRGVAPVVVLGAIARQIANRGESFVPKFVSGIQVVGELASRREYSAQRAPPNRSR
jgi:hypothetical protein